MVSSQELDVIITKIFALTDKLNNEEVQTVIENLEDTLWLFF